MRLPRFHFNKNILIWFIPLLSLVVGGAVGIYTTNRPVQTIPTSTTDASSGETPAPTDEQPEQPTTSTQPNISVAQPTQDQVVGDTFTIRGKARVFENTVQLRLKNASSGTVYLNTYTTAVGSAGTFSDYSYIVDVTKLQAKPKTGDVLRLEVFQESAKDGSEVDKVVFNIVYRPTEATMQVLIYLPKNEGNEFSCDLVYPVKRTVPKRTDTATAALEQLLAGPSATDLANGYNTTIAKGTKLLGLTIKNGTAYANFNESIEANGHSSCQIISIRNQITETLKQFPTVKDVIIQENGNAGTLQP